jgi:hypothetical protein
LPQYDEKLINTPDLQMHDEIKKYHTFLLFLFIKMQTMASNKINKNAYKR